MIYPAAWLNQFALGEIESHWHKAEVTTSIAGKDLMGAVNPAAAGPFRASARDGD